MSKIYIAARFHKRPQANELANFLQLKGHSITSRWVLPDQSHVLPTGLSKQAEDSERERFAKEDLFDVISSDWMISLMEEPRGTGRGGRHVEFGIALGVATCISLGVTAWEKSMKITIIGPRETVFHHLPTVEHFNTVEDFKKSYFGVN